MRGKLIWSIFWALVGVFAVVAGTIFIGVPIFGRLQMPALFSALLGGTVALFGLGVVGLGVTLLVLTKRAKVRGLLKKFFLLTGASTVGLPVFAVLHNLVTALFITCFGFGTDFDEPVFFILAITVCPIAFLVGAIGSIVLFSKKPWLVPKSPSRRR
jgi:hypothetical protein